MFFFYFKCYPTFDLLGFLFDLNRSNLLRNIQKLIATLEKTLGRKMVLPKREIHTSKELFKSFPELRNVFVDGTERPTQKPKDNDKQKENYSGKKKRHMRKNIVMSDEDKRIIFPGPTAGGRRHDYETFVCFENNALFSDGK